MDHLKKRFGKSSGDTFGGILKRVSSTINAQKEISAEIVGKFEFLMENPKENSKEIVK